MIELKVDYDQNNLLLNRNTVPISIHLNIFKKGCIS